MNLDQQISQKLDTLVNEAKGVRIHRPSDWPEYVDRESWEVWASSCLNLLQRAFGVGSTHFQSFRKLYEEFGFDPSDYGRACGIMKSAQREWGEGFCKSVETQIAGEIFTDFVVLARECLANGNKDSAAVLACAAIEDTLKKFATINGLVVEGKDLTEVINMLKSAGLIQGVEAKLVSSFPKLRNSAMHAEWGKVSEVEVGAVIGFVEQFLLTKFNTKI